MTTCLRFHTDGTTFTSDLCVLSLHYNLQAGCGMSSDGNSSLTGWFIFGPSCCLGTSTACESLLQKPPVLAERLVPFIVNLNNPGRGVFTLLGGARRSSSGGKLTRWLHRGTDSEILLAPSHWRQTNINGKCESRWVVCHSLSVHWQERPACAHTRLGRREHTVAVVCCACHW